MTSATIFKAIRAVSTGSLGKRLIQRASESIRYSDFDQWLTIGTVGQCADDTPVEFDTPESAELALMRADLTHATAPAIVHGDNVGILSASDVVNMLWVGSACDTWSTRYALDGVAITPSTMVATDGRRLHSARMSHGLIVLDDRRTIVPIRAVKALAALVRLFKDRTVAVRLTKDTIVFSSDYWTFEARLVEGLFPQWENVIPARCGRREDIYTISADDIARAKLTVKETALQNKVEKARAKKEKAKFEEKLPIIELGGALFDWRYILDASDDKPGADLHVTSAAGAAIVERGERLAVVMTCKK